MKQRPLTEIQLTVLNMSLGGKSNSEIAYALSIHPDTVSCKRRAIEKGIKKGAYNNLPDHLKATGDLFDN